MAIVSPKEDALTPISTAVMPFLPNTHRRLDGNDGNAAIAGVARVRIDDLLNNASASY